MWLVMRQYYIYCDSRRNRTHIIVRYPYSIFRDHFVYATMRPASERWYCNLTSSFIGWVHPQKDPWYIAAVGKSWLVPHVLEIMDLVFTRLNCNVPTRMMMSWHQTLSALLALCEGNPPIISGFPSQRPVIQNFWNYFDASLNKLLYKQSSHWWFEMQWCSCDDICNDIFS